MKPLPSAARGAVLAIAAALLLGACADPGAEGAQTALPPPPAPAPARTDHAIGRPTVIEGDVLEVDGRRVRLQAIDAPDVATRTGKRSLIELRRIIGLEPVNCELLELEPPAPKVQQGWIGRCTSEGVDIAQELVRRGWARALQRYGDSYVIEEASARAAGRGMWPKPAAPRPGTKPATPRTAAKKTG